MWTQHTAARDADGNIVDVSMEREKATCFCSFGALYAAKDRCPSGTPAWNLVRQATPYGNPIEYNDTHTHEEVMAVWNKAIAKAEALSGPEVLEAAKAKIEKQESWTQGYYAKDAEGNYVEAHKGTEAACFCSLGALEAATGTEHLSKGWNSTLEKFLEAAVVEAGGYAGVAVYNDTRTHTEVLAVFERAIQLAKEAAEKA